MEAILEYLFDFRILIGAVLGFGVAVPVVLNNIQWFSSRLAAVVKEGEAALEKAKKMDEMKDFLQYLKDQGVLPK